MTVNPGERGGNSANWQSSVQTIEQGLVPMIVRGTTIFEVALHVLGGLKILVETQQVDWSALQDYQHSRATPLFELIARPVEEVVAMPGMTCRDIVTGEPRAHIVTIVFDPRGLAEGEDLHTRLGAHDHNMALLAQAGMWFEE